MSKPLHKNLALAINSAVIGATVCFPTVTQADTTVHYNIPAGNLSQVLNRFASQSGIAIVMNDSELKDMNSSGLQGRYSLTQGFQKILSGTGLTARKTAVGYSIESNANQSDVTALTPVEVTGKLTTVEPKGFKAEYQETATKMAMSLRETPQAISVVTRDSIDARQVTNLASALELTAGVSNNADTSGGLTATPGAFGGKSGFDQKFIIRSQIADIRTDGFKVTSGLGGDDGVDLAAFERIEVVRGAPGLYGRGSLGGFINKVRKKPKAEFDADISVHAGSFDTYRAEADITGALDNDNKLLGQMAFAYDNSGAFTEEIENERLLLAPSFSAEISDKTNLLVHFLYQKDEFDPNPGIPVQLVGDRITILPQFNSRTELYGRPGEKSEIDQYQAALTLKHELSDRWLASLNLHYSERENDFIQSGYAYVSFGAVYFAGYKDKWERESWAGELRLEGTFDAFEQEHRVILGLEANEQEFTREFGKSYTGSIPLNSFVNSPNHYPNYSKSDLPITINRRTELENQAIYAQFMLSLSERTKLLAGARYDDSDEHFRSSGVFSNNANDKANNKKFTKRFGLTHKFNSNFSAYGIYSESFDPILGRARNGPLDPQTGEGVEAGLKTEWFDKKLGINLAIFRQELDKIPLVDPVDNNYSISSGLHRTDGIELEINGSPYPGWTLGGAASWSDNEFLEADDPNFGLAINGSVDKQFSLYTNYEFQSGDLKGLGLGVTYINVGDRNFISGSQIYADGYDRFDLHVKYKASPNWDANLLVRNLTDETYLDSVNPQLWGGSYWGAPRAAMLTVNYNF